MKVIWIYVVFFVCKTLKEFFLYLHCCEWLLHERWHRAKIQVTSLLARDAWHGEALYELKKSDDQCSIQWLMPFCQWAPTPVTK
jgi:hypothetical protein